MNDADEIKILFTNIFFPFQRFYLFTFREREREGDKQYMRETHRSVASSTPPNGDLAPIPGMCPDWELNQRPLSWQAGAQSTEPHLPGLPLFRL